MSVCQIVLDHDDNRQIENVVVFLKESGFTIDKIDSSIGVIYCTGESAVVHGLSHCKLFGYVRVEMTYIADYPPGYPRDRP